MFKPENKDYPVIRPKEDVEIYGVVVGLVRKYKQRRTPELRADWALANR